MTGGGNRPSGGKMGTSIRASVSAEAVATAEKELADLEERLSNLRNRISDAVKKYTDSEKAISPLEINFTKTQKEVAQLSRMFVFHHLYVYCSCQLHQCPWFDRLKV